MKLNHLHSELDHLSLTVHFRLTDILLDLRRFVRLTSLHLLKKFRMLLTIHPSWSLLKNNN